jgi:hypothetical protein
MPRRSSNPLAGITGPQGWQQGTEPALEPPAAPQGDDLAAALFDPVCRRAVSIVKRRYNAVPGTSSWSSFHDKQCLKIRQQLLTGTPVHELDPTPTPTPRKRQTMPWEWGKEHLLGG